MYLFDNPVLQRELLVNLRMGRSFLLLFAYLSLLATVVFFAWPADKIRLDLTQTNAHSSQLINMFFLGQYVLASLMTPSFAAGAVTGEKERKTYEMLLASPLNPKSIVLGKLIAALTHIGILVFCSLPIVMLCLPLGGVSFYELLAAYVVLFSSIVLFGMISVAVGSHFSRTSASLVVSYLLILPLALLAVVFWEATSNNGPLRFNIAITVIPGCAGILTLFLFFHTASQMLYPPDVGSEGKEVIDLESEAKRSIGLVIQRDQFPDRLFAPPKRTSLMKDGTNPVYDKEMRSEIFGQGTLMLRLAIQISMLLAIPLMAIFLYINRHLAAWYISYVVLFNVLIGPVFSAGSVSSERERQTLDLLLTTMITPWQILWGKLLSGLRVSSVLTAFLVWPVILAAVFVPAYWTNVPSLIGYFVIIALTCTTTAMLALFFSSLFKKTSTSLMVTYLTILLLFLVPIASDTFCSWYYPSTGFAKTVHATTVTSPFSAAFEMPIYFADIDTDTRWIRNSNVSSWFNYQWRDLQHFFGYIGFTTVFNSLLLTAMIWLFHSRWRVSTSSG